MKLKSFFVILLCLLILGSCNKDKKPKYTISGKLVDPSGVSVFSNVTILIDLLTEGVSDTGNPELVVHGKMGECLTDNAGYYSFTYQLVDTLKLKRPLIWLHNDFSAAFVEIDKNINKDLLSPSLGTLNLFLVPEVSLKDTLFIGWTNWNSSFFKRDTIFSEINGYYKKLRLPIDYIKFKTGRGSRNFNSNNSGNEQWVFIHGDPDIDSATIKY